MKGSVYELRGDRSVRGHEQAGRRYGVVITASRFVHLSQWVVAPTSTSASARSRILHPVVDWGAGESCVLVDAIRSVDPHVRLGEHVGYLGLAEMRAVDVALAILLDLSRPGAN